MTNEINVFLQATEKMVKEFTLTMLAGITILLTCYCIWTAISYYLHKKLGHRRYKRLCKNLKAFFS
jgi:hypothetical protein